MVALSQRVLTRKQWQGAGTVPPEARLSYQVARPTQDAAAGRRDILTRTIKADVIPRLLLIRGRAARPRMPETAMTGPIAAEIGELAAIAMRQDFTPALAFVDSVRLRGVSLDSVFLDLLTPAARHLGEMWDQDRASFGEVTLGLAVLHQVLRELGPAFQTGAAATGHDLRALLAPVPGEQHNFGLAMVAEFFRRAGWSVRGEAMTTRRELVTAVRGTWFAVVGLSLASEGRLEALAACIRAIRRASRNPAVGILVGGPIFVAHPELVRSVGADATAVDGKHVVLQANSMLAGSACQV